MTITYAKSEGIMYSYGVEKRYGEGITDDDIN